MPVIGRLRVHQDLTIRAVEEVAGEVVVEVLEAAGTPRHISFQFAGSAANEHIDQLSHWMTTSRRLTYVAGGANAVLLDEAESFRRSFGDELPDVCWPDAV